MDNSNIENTQQNKDTKTQRNEKKDEKKSKQNPLTWLFIAVGLALFISYVIVPFLNNLTSNGAEPGVGGGPPSAEEQEVDNRELTLSDVPVHSVINDRVFWIGPDEQNRVLVVAEDNNLVSKVRDIRTGQNINLDVVVRKLPSKEDMMRNWELSDEQASSILSQPGYLSLRDITTI